MSSQLGNNSEKQIISIVKTNFSNNGDIVRESLVIEDIDWNDLVENGSYRNLIPLVYYTLGKNNLLCSLTVEAQNSLRTTYLGMAQHSIRLFNELEKILDILERAEIDIMVFKGAALAETVYPNIVLRPMADIDFLVRDRNDVYRIERLLEPAGYSPIYRESDDAFVDAVISEWTFISSKNKQVALDFHHNLPYLGNGIKSTKNVWNDAFHGYVAGHKTWLMRPEEAIPELIAHELIQHREDRVLLYCDLGFIIKKHQINWQEILDNIDQSPAGEYVWRALQRARVDFGIQIPVEVIETIRKRSSTLGSFRTVLITDSKLIHSNLFESLVGAESFGKKIWLFLRYIFPSTNYMAQAYQTTSMPRIAMLYIYRPLKILARSVFLIGRTLAHSVRQTVIVHYKEKP